jgi:hypothetical protein
MPLDEQRLCGRYKDVLALIFPYISHSDANRIITPTE